MIRQKLRNYTLENTTKINYSVIKYHKGFLYYSPIIVSNEIYIEVYVRSYRC